MSLSSCIGSQLRKGAVRIPETECSGAHLKYSRKEIILYRDAFRDWLRQNA